MDALRGVAALSVMWFHFCVNDDPDFLKPGLLTQSATWGWAGVQIFFVISGFIIPHALFKGGYRLRHDYFAFIWKRVLRLYPPHLASVAIAIGSLWLSKSTGLAHGATTDLSSKRLLSHLFLWNNLNGVEWYNSVYWTLAVEFQWYFLAGLLFPLLVARTRWIPLAILAGMAATSITLPGYRTLSGNLVSFAFGVAVFQFSIGRFSKSVLAGILFGLVLASQKVLGWCLLNTLAFVASNLACGKARRRSIPAEGCD